jgi:hypothetical protein
VDPRLRVGIVPASQLRARARLWAALEQAYPVRFEGRDRDALRELEGVLVFDTDDALFDAGKAAASPEVLADTGVPSLILHGEETSGRMPGAVALATHPALARPLRGGLLSDGYALTLKTTLKKVDVEGVVLATLDGAPVWLLEPDSGTARHHVACAPAELDPTEALRERLRPGRCLALLTLVHFLGDLTAHLRPSPPMLRAAFVIDDPNLRRPRYGHLDYAELLRHARGHGYHLSVAMVPLDARFAHPRAVRLFREGAAHLSLCVHGNDHDGPELGRPRLDAEAMAIVAQALRRTTAFEQRTGIAVDRVMVPPHERLSEPVARALYACGFQAVTTTRPYPWVADTSDRSWLTRPPAVGPLAAWGPIDVIAGGLSVLLRADFREHPREDLALRAFLGQPLILYGHHDLLAGGPEALAAAAAEIDRLGDVEWSSLGDIAHTYTHPHPPLDRRPLAAIPLPPRRLAPLLRRLASEGRDRAGAIVTR